MTKSAQKRIRWYVGSISGLLFVVMLFWSSVCDSTNIQAENEEISSSSPYIPDTVLFCGEPVPVDFFDVKESLERELLVNSYYHSQTILFIKKAARYFPVIEPILKENNIPDDFKYLAVAESGLANVVSPSKAVGFWQILSGTAKDYGLEVNDEVDERYHLEKATGAACKYLQASYDKYGSWTTSAASYNVGRRGVDRQINKQKETDYYDLLFNEETARYVFRIIALKLVLESPEKYDFHLSKDELYKPIPYKEVIVDSPVESWADFAQENNTNYKILKKLNPWLREKNLMNKSGKEYIIYVPTRKARVKTTK